MSGRGNEKKSMRNVAYDLNEHKFRFITRLQTHKNAVTQPVLKVYPRIALSTA